MAQVLHPPRPRLTCEWSCGGGGGGDSVGSSGGRGIHAHPHRPPGPGSEALVAVAVVVAGGSTLEAAPAFPHRSRGPVGAELSVPPPADWPQIHGS